MNIALTTACNNHCSFCFQSELHKNPCEFKFEDLKRVIDWGKQTYPQKVTLLGGEPTLYSKFKEAIDLIMQEFYFSEVLLITNLLGSSSDFEYLTKFPNLRYLVNISFDENKVKRFFTNLEVIKLSKNICLSITLTQDEEQNKKFISRLFGILSTYPQIKELRIGLECPRPNATDFKYYNYDSEILYLTEELPKYDNGLYVHFDCPVNFCQLSNKIADKINQGLTIIQPNINFKCNDPCIDILPDLSAKYCFSSSDNFKIDNIFDFKDEDELIGHMRNIKNNYQCQNKKCLQCNCYNIDCFPCHAFDEVLKKKEE